MRTSLNDGTFLIGQKRRMGKRVCVTGCRAKKREQREDEGVLVIFQVM